MFDDTDSRSSPESLTSFVFQCTGWETYLVELSMYPPIPWLGGSKSPRTRGIMGLNMFGEAWGFQESKAIILTVC